MNLQDKPILIIGGGVAGPVLAMFLQRAGLRAVIYEAHDAPSDEAGAFLNLAPNGLNVLKTLGIEEQIRALGFSFDETVFQNRQGARVGAIESHTEAARFGAQSVMLKRGKLHHALTQEAQRRGIQIHFGKRLERLTLNPNQVTACFQDGSAAEGALLIGCDGIHSRTREIILPDAPKPTYTGIVDCGGFTHCDTVPFTNSVNMVFGARAFFGYFVAPTREIFWFNNIEYPQARLGETLQAIPSAEWRVQLLESHHDDPRAVRDILRSTQGEIGRWPIYDIPFLPTWHQGRVCVVGDAAHATSPHAGQGASLAMEDGLTLAQCLRDVSTPEQAFEMFHRLRKERVEAVILAARSIGNQKALSNPLATWFRDRMLPFFLKLGASSTASLYSYRADWDLRVA